MISRTTNVSRRKPQKKGKKPVERPKIQVWGGRAALGLTESTLPSRTRKLGGERPLRWYRYLKKLHEGDKARNASGEREKRTRRDSYDCAARLAESPRPKSLYEGIGPKRNSQSMMIPQIGL